MLVQRPHVSDCCVEHKQHGGSDHGRLRAHSPPAVLALPASRATTEESDALWQLDTPTRYTSFANMHEGFEANGCGHRRHAAAVVRCAEARISRSWAASLGNMWNSSSIGGVTNRRIYLDLGANAPETSVLPFVYKYPDWRPRVWPRWVGRTEFPSSKNRAALRAAGRSQNRLKTVKKRLIKSSRRAPDPPLGGKRGSVGRGVPNQKDHFPPRRASFVRAAGRSVAALGWLHFHPRHTRNEWFILSAHRDGACDDVVVARYPKAKRAFGPASR
eukprot:scaffold106508_cov99-Phaeocystis_antarctica.AAC.1